METKKPDLTVLPGGIYQVSSEQIVEEPIGREQLMQFTTTLRRYAAGLHRTKARIIAAENWWKLRNTTEEQRTTLIGSDGGFVSKSGWLHNVIVNKHADAMESYPEPNVLPREAGDRGEAQILSAIIPCILEQNHFERTYSDAMWQKMKTGTGVYKIVWDSSKLNGLGDISIERVNLLNLYWEPGVADIQESRYFFHTELMDKDILQQMYPQIGDRIKNSTFTDSKFLYDDTVNTEDKATVIEVYYHKWSGQKMTLQYCKYVEDIVLYATENDNLPVSELSGEQRPAMAETGLYDHGRYPYEFDALYPIEGSPCGYGYVDVCLNPQTEIDLMKTAFVKSTQAGATPRYFSRVDGNINEEEFLDLSKPIVHVTGTIDEATLRPVAYNRLDGVYVSLLDRTIQELRETSGNTETSTGSTSSGVTAASAIAALQEASGKGSKDSTLSAYRVFSRICELCIELIRQFYDMPRQFRIVGQYGMEQYISYTNQGIQPQHQGNAFGQDLGFRLPVFDIKVSAQKKNVYTKISQNELAMQFFQMGFFNPQATDQALMCLDLMEFDGKDTVMQKVSQNGTMYQKLIQYMQLALTLCAASRPDMVQGISQDIMQTMGVQPSAMAAAAPQQMAADNVEGQEAKEHPRVENARKQAQAASQPGGGEVIRGGKQ